MNEQTLPPNVAAFELASAAIASKAIWVAAELGVADHLEGEATPVERLAAGTGADPEALYRVMRFLASAGVFRELENRRFAHTPISRTLASDHPSRARAAVRMIASPYMWSAIGQFRHAVLTGEAGGQKAHGMPVFDYFGQHPEDAAVFNDAMIGIHGGEPPAVAAAYPFGEIQTVADVGGGSGNMLIHVLRAHGHLKGILFDLPHVAEAARARLAQEGLGGRCEVRPGSFFESVPEGADAYILSHIIHDWDEASCLKILQNCRRAMKQEAKLLLVEFVIPGPNDRHPAKPLDLIMLAVTGGRERTPDEYAALFQKAGLRLSRVVPTASPASVIEAVRA